MRQVAVKLEEKGGWLYEKIAPGGRLLNMVTGINGERFNRFWLETVAG